MLLRPVPPTLAPSLQRSRSVPRPVVLDVQLSHSFGAIVDRAGDFSCSRQAGTDSVKKGKRGACKQKAATVLPNRTAAT